MKRFACPAPAKINLALHVTGQRTDGYHTLESLVVFTEVGDHLAIQVEDMTEGSVALDVSGPFAADIAMLDPNDNLVVRGAKAVFEQAKAAMPDIRLTLEKNLPVASGVGGGSADAAAALLLANSLVEKPLDDNALVDLGTTLGADIAMCLMSSPLIARGIGEHIEPLGAFPELHLALVNPAIAVPTPKVFSALAMKHNRPLAPLSETMRHTALIDWLGDQRNDLQAPAVERVPVIADCLDALRASGAQVTRMSGSGATCFGVFGTAEAAQIAAAEIGSAHPGWWCMATHSADFGMERVVEIG